jgi:hypothetical protein
MEVLAGVIIGILVTLALLKRPITLNVNKTVEEIRHPIEMPDLGKEMKKPASESDKVYDEDMKSFIDDVNNMMLGGKPNVEANK